MTYFVATREYNFVLLLLDFQLLHHLCHLLNIVYTNFSCKLQHVYCDGWVLQFADYVRNVLQWVCVTYSNILMVKYFY
jgi:hypothetical protein